MNILVKRKSKGSLYNKNNNLELRTDNETEFLNKDIEIFFKKMKLYTKLRY